MVEKPLERSWKVSNWYLKMVLKMRQGLDSTRTYVSPIFFGFDLKEINQMGFMGWSQLIFVSESPTAWKDTFE